MWAAQQLVMLTGYMVACLRAKVGEEGKERMFGYQSACKILMPPHFQPHEDGSELSEPPPSSRNSGKRLLREIHGGMGG